MPNPLDANGSMLRLNDNFGRGGTGSALALDAPPGVVRRRPTTAYDPSASPAMGLNDSMPNPYPAIIAQQKNDAARAKFRGQAFDETWDSLTPQAKAAFKPAGVDVGSQGILRGQFPIEDAPGHASGQYRTVDASTPRTAADVEGIERVNALPAFQRSLDLRSAGAPGIPPAHAQTIDALQNQLLLEKMKNQGMAGPANPLNNPNVAGPPAPSAPVPTAGRSAPASPIDLGAAPPGNFDVSRYVAADQSFAQSAAPSGEASPASTLANLDHLNALYKNAQTPADRASILKTIAAVYGDSTREAVASTAAGSRENVAGTTAQSREAVASTAAGSRENVADKNNAARKDMEGMKIGSLEEIARGGDATKREIAQNVLQERYADLGAKERHWSTLSDEARGRIASKGQLTPEDIARYRGEFDKINATRETHGLPPHPYPDYLQNSPPPAAMASATPAPPAPAAAPPPAAAAPDASKFVARPDGTFQHPDLPNVTYRKVPGGYQRVN